MYGRAECIPLHHQQFVNVQEVSLSTISSLDVLSVSLPTLAQFFVTAGMQDCPASVQGET